MGVDVIELDGLEELANATNVDEFAPESTDGLTTSEEEKQFPGLDRSDGSATAIEREEIKSVAGSDPAAMSHFLDGRQSTFMMGHVEGKHGAFHPLQLHLSGAVTITSDRDIYHGPLTRLKVLVPNIERLPSRMKRRLESSSLEIIETLEDRGAENDYQVMRKIGVERSSNERDKLEQDMIRAFDEDTLLCKDGTIPEPTEFVVDRTNIIGVIKNHHKRYLDFSDDKLMFGMGIGERTWLFEIEKSGNPLYSCYLRIREIDEDPRSGVVRVEIHPDREHEIDQICARIVDESYPLKRNVPSWKNQIYPFHVAEKAVSSAMPSRDVVLSSLRGLGIIT